MTLKTNKLLASLSLVTVLLLAASAGADAPATLRYKFKEGEKLYYVMDQKMSTIVNVAGNEVEVTMTQVFDLSWTIGAVDKEGKAKVSQRFERIRFNMESTMGNSEYDSKEGKEPEGMIGALLGPFFKALAGSEIKCTMDSRGRVGDVVIPQKLEDALPQGDGIGGAFGKEGIKKLAEQGGIVLPEGPVTKGTKWTNTVDAKMPFGKIKVTSECTAEGVEVGNGKKLEKIAVKPKTTVEPGDNNAISMKLKSEVANGTVYFDGIAGRLVESKLEQEMDMDVTVNGMDISQKTKQAITLKLVDKPAK